MLGQHIDLDWESTCELGGSGMTDGRNRDILDVVIIVVSYRSVRDLPRLIASVAPSAADLTWHLIVVDNAGEDLGSQLAPDHRVTVFDAGANLGYSGGINVGLTHMPPARWVVFLNPDLVLQPNALSRLVAVPDQVAASVPRILDAHGVCQSSLRREPTLLRALGDAAFGAAWPGRPAWLSETVRHDRQYRTKHTVDWATGAALAVRSDVISAVGEWDEATFFMYSEETDYARRIRTIGGVLLYVPDAVVEHHGGGSGVSPQLDALQEVNRVRYFAKWHAPLATASFTAVTLLRNVVRPHRPGARAATAALLSARVRASLPGGAR